MLKKLKILSILGLLFISNAFSISKNILDTPKLYLPGGIANLSSIDLKDYESKKYDTSKDPAKNAIDKMGLKDRPSKVIFTEQNFEVFNKTDKSITIALQLSIQNSLHASGEIYSNPTFEIISPKKQSTVIRNLQTTIDDMPEINKLSRSKRSLTLYIWPNKSAYKEQRDGKILNLSQNPGLVYVYKFKDLEKFNKKNNPKYTMYLTFDGKINDKKGDIGLRPQTGQLGKIFGKETGLASKTETGLSLVTNIDKNDIEQFK